MTHTNVNDEIEIRKQCCIFVNKNELCSILVKPFITQNNI